MSQEVKRIKKLDGIANDKRFSLGIDPNPIKSRRLETCSYVEADIIGRDVDLEKIVDMLLDSHVEQNVSFHSIVGMGGLGKTALAQLVYNDARVTTAFPLKLWTCVADEDQEVLDVKGVVTKILTSTMEDKNNYEGCSMEVLQRQLRRRLSRKKYLLVLDDVWTEDYVRWRVLKQLFMDTGERGSWVVVTTRSHRTAMIMGDGPKHYLQGLSKEDSWDLFTKAAFGSQQSNPSDDFVEIGHDIVDKCANVPLAIIVMGSLLFGQELHKWLSVQKMGLANVEDSQKNILSILKLSYYQLESSLKSCFGYCAIFPKDYVIQKEKLIRLWLAQGYIPLDDDDDDLEGRAEDTFSILVRRCFFQDTKKDVYGNIISCKMHDLMHDVAQQVVGKEICTLKTMNEDVDKKVRHLSLIQSESTDYFFRKAKVRSYLQFRESYVGLKIMDYPRVEALLANWKILRTLDLSRLKIKHLPESIVDLIHLRYLDLSYNYNLEILPGSFTKLGNLQTLNLKRCRKLKELPKDLGRLVKLRVLVLEDCYKLRYMPKGIGTLSCLRTLNLFVLGERNSSKKEFFNELEDLKSLENITGFLEMRIRFTKASPNAYKKNRDSSEGGCLRNKKYLKQVVFHFGEDDEKEREEYDEAMMDELQPHSDLMRLVVSRYHGVRMPPWAREDSLASFLPNLVEIRFLRCRKLQNLGQLQALQLPRLKVLHMVYCPNLTAVLECPALELLYLYRFNERLGIIPISSEASYSSSCDVGLKLKEVVIDNVAWLHSLPMNGSHEGLKLFIDGDDKVESLQEAREVFRSCSSSLKFLIINYCNNLKSVVSGGLEHLSALEYLEITDCSKLSESEEVEKEQLFCQSLCSLKLSFLNHMVELPNWIQYLTSLQILHIRNVKRLESMPKWISKLTSLRELRLEYCSAILRKRCQQSTGEDWPYIQHIPSIVLTGCYS